MQPASHVAPLLCVAGRVLLIGLWGRLGPRSNFEALSPSPPNCSLVDFVRGPQCVVVVNKGSSCSFSALLGIMLHFLLLLGHCSRASLLYADVCHFRCFFILTHVQRDKLVQLTRLCLILSADPSQGRGPVLFLQHANPPPPQQPQPPA